MLRLTALLLVGLLVGSTAAALPSDMRPSEELPGGLHPRVALTAGGYDHFQGELLPGGRRLVFVGNANATTELFHQETGGAPALLFDESADVSQPRPSPDGRRLLYISYRGDAGGDACLYEFGGQQRRCLTREGLAVLHVFWFPDGRSLGALTRRRLDADTELRRFKVDARPGEPGELLLERNMASPALSPDGRWLAYVPLERVGGGLALKAEPGLVLRRMGQAEEVRFVPDLPGSSGYPAFSRDGKHLYFVQFLNDTNFDGVIDGNDNGVLFRVPLQEDGGPPVRRGTYEQLTSGRSNCQYPAPGEERLVATCVRAGYLQLYSLPLEGIIPAEWDAARLEEEVSTSRDPWVRLLLLGRLLAGERDEARRRELHRRLVLHHLARREYESAEHFLRSAREGVLPGSPLAAWMEVLGELLAHRREEQLLGHGKLNARFIASERERLRRLAGPASAPPSSASRLAGLLVSEIHHVLGDKARAWETFRALDFQAEEDAITLVLYAREAARLLRSLEGAEEARGAPPAWERMLETWRMLALHPALEEADRLRYAEAFRHDLLRGKPRGARRGLVERERERAPPGSTLAFVLEVEGLLQGLESEPQARVEARLRELYGRTNELHRRRALVMDAVARSARDDREHLLYEMGRFWVEEIERGHPERKYAEALFSEVVLERAYLELAAGRPERAEQLFSEVTQQTDSLEAHVGLIEASARQGHASARILAGYEARYAATPDAPALGFARAYLLARELPGVKDVGEERARVERALALLAPVTEALPRAPEVHHLHGYLAHRLFHRTGNRQAAMVAHGRYHLALDLAPGHHRIRASVLHELGLLQASLGNHRIALRHLEERERLPFVTAESELSFRLAKARSLFHGASYPEAKEEARRALAIVEREPTLGHKRALVLDRSALYHYAAGAHAQGHAIYQELLPLVKGDTLAERVKVRLGLGATALGAGESGEAVRVLGELRELLATGEPLRPEGEPVGLVAAHFGKEDYRALVSGLLSRAHRAEGQTSEALRAMEERWRLLKARHKRTQRSEDLLEAAVAAHHLGELAYRLGDYGQALRHLEAGLDDADRFRAETGTEVEPVTVALVRALAELHLYGKVPRERFRHDPLRRTEEAFAALNARPNPRLAGERFLFTTYLTWMDLRVTP